MTHFSETAAYRRAKSRVEQRRSFYVHALVYVAVNAGLALLNLATSPGSIWFIYPLIGWGVALAAHGLTVTAGDRYFGAEWEERVIQEEMERERQRLIAR